MHEPHQAPHAYVEKYRGRFDAGWDEVRRQWFERQLASGIIPLTLSLRPRNPGVDAWNDVPDKQQKFANRLQEAFAGFLDHSDAQIGRLLDYLETSDQLDNTIVILTSDNGASGMGGPTGIMSSGSGGVRQPPATAACSSMRPTARARCMLTIWMRFSPVLMISAVRAAGAIYPGAGDKPVTRRCAGIR